MYGLHYHGIASNVGMEKLQNLGNMATGRVVYMDGHGPKLVPNGQDGRTDVSVPMSVADIFM